MEYIPRTTKKKLVIADQLSPLENNFNSITAETVNIEYNNLFNDNL